MEPKVTQYGSHMIMTNVTKPVKKKYLNIDTRYRDNYDPLRPVNYNISLPERVNEVKSIRVINIEIPVSFYNISANLGNNTFNLTVLGYTTTIIIPDDQYTIDTLTDMINEQIKAAGPPYVNIIFYFENYYSKFVNTDAENEFLIDFDVNMQGTMDMQNLTFKLGWLLGFREPSYTIPHSLILSSPAFVNLTGPRYLYLVIDEFKNNNPHSFVTMLNTSEINKNILARITMNYTEFPYGTIVCANLSTGNLMTDKREFNDTINLQRMNIQLVNERGVPIDLNVMDFSFCM
jgi:hypothetical protein